jgi:hypothetical protein
MNDMLSDLRTDLRDAMRAFRRRPGFALLAVLTLVVGMSVNTVAFSVVNGLLFKRPAFAEPGRLGWIFRVTRGDPLGEVSVPQYEGVRAQARTLDAVSAEGRLPLRWRDGARTQQIWALLVTANYFETLGVRPEIGRVFGEGDRDHDVAIVSHAFWTSRLGSAPVGHATITVNERTHVVVGVLPAAFQGPGGLYSPDVWVPLERRVALGLPSELSAADRGWLTLLGRMRPGVTPTQAAAELAALFGQIGRIFRCRVSEFLALSA